MRQEYTEPVRTDSDNGKTAGWLMLFIGLEIVAVVLAVMWFWRFMDQMWR